jgi:hypothetical protein
MEGREMLPDLAEVAAHRRRDGRLPRIGLGGELRQKGIDRRRLLH